MRGRPAFSPTDDQRRQVKAMAAYGVPQDDIATVLAIDAKTLRKHFWTDLQTGVLEANAKVAQSLFQRATTEKGSAGVTAAIFWLKVRAGWREAARSVSDVGFADEATPLRPAKLGKKQQADQAALRAGEGSDWGDDLRPGVRSN